jgi:hypothetical protein
VYHCDKFDLALLKLVDGPLARGSAEIVGLSVGSFGTDVGEQANDKTPVVCIGNPFDVDLECPEGEEPTADGTHAVLGERRCVARGLVDVGGIGG